MSRDERHGTQPPATTPSSPRGPVLVDRITENVLQLLYAALQEIAEARLVDDPHTALASRRVREAIAELRKIAALLQHEHLTCDREPIVDPAISRTDLYRAL